MDKMHEGYVLEGYNAYTEGLGEFFKEERYSKQSNALLL